MMMLEVLRKRGLVIFLFALAAVSAFTRSPGAALLLIAIAAEEIQRRDLGGPAAFLTAVRWGGFLGALGFLLALRY
jgi:hypothetical protein